MLSDTVGFISDLPTTLVAAFRATLEEVVEADLVLHVRDISHPETDAQRHDVETLLENLGVAAPAIVEAWNKADRLGSEQRREVESAIARHERQPVLVSASTGEGLERLGARIDKELGAKDEIFSLQLSPREGRLLSWLHAHADVLQEESDEEGHVTTRFRIDAANRGKLDGQLKRAGRPNATRAILV
jgi:GTP-binding protein HflX